MNKLRGIQRMAAGVVFLLVLAACSVATFDPVGSYTGSTSVAGGGTYPTTATITATSTSGSWAFQLVVNGSTYTGACTHSTSGSPGALTCTWSDTSLTGTFTGTLTGNTWSGTFTDSASETGTFTLTR